MLAGFFAGTPAPTGASQTSGQWWVRACPRRGQPWRQSTALPSVAMPLTCLPGQRSVSAGMPFP
ncbi:MAG TPA: hypothetical protein DD418_00135 [Pseudomonas sp.]|nr:hypothetical protein [Pseudomonas sp.]